MSNAYTTKNYIAHGGDEWVIGGKLTFLPGAVIEGGDFGEAGDGNVVQLPFIANSQATNVAGLKESFNALLTALRAAGLMAAETVVTDEQTDPAPAGGDGT